PHHVRAARERRRHFSGARDDRRAGVHGAVARARGDAAGQDEPRAGARHGVLAVVVGARVSAAGLGAAHSRAPRADGAVLQCARGAAARRLGEVTGLALVLVLAGAPEFTRKRNVPHHPASIMNDCPAGQARVISESIESAIESGAPAYNEGDVDACFKLYEQTAL